MSRLLNLVATVLVTVSVFGQGVDPGYVGYRGWADPTGSGKPHYCRVIGLQGSYSLSCVEIANTGKHVDSGNIDRGFAEGAAWVDINADGKTDYCRLIGSNEKPQLACNLSIGTSFTKTLESPVFTDSGYPEVRGWFGGRKKSLYCRGIGSRDKPQIACKEFSIVNNTLVF